MKNLSFTLTMVLCVLIMQAQVSNVVQPDQDSVRLTETHTINLDQGWSGISSYLDPSNPDVALLMAAIENQLVILMDLDGNFYQPSSKNYLQNWDFKQGYFIKMASEETLEIAGLYPLSRQLDLQTGWNLIPVLSDVPVDIEDYFCNGIDQIEIITEVAGLNVFWPQKSITTLQQLFPGKAYLVKALSSFSILKIPTVITAPVEDITATSAICGGDVTVSGSAPVTLRGVVWNLDPDPTYEQNSGFTQDGFGTGEFISSVYDLIPGTFYYIRAYAKNCFGIAYGETLIFDTESGAIPCPDIPVFTDARDGKVYNTVLIGSQCWMVENLAWLPSVNPPGDGSNLFVRYYVTGYNGSNVANAKATNNYQNYGVLYNWPAAMNACPAGWHLPTDDEWSMLVITLGNEGVAGGKMKSTRTYPDPHPRWNSPNTDATNSSGFTGLPGGYRDFNGNFFPRGFVGYFWSATEYIEPEKNDIIIAWYRSLNYYWPDLTRFFQDKEEGYSVRCLKN